MIAAEERLQLLDWKQKVTELYQMVRTAEDLSAVSTTWRAGRDALFRNHPQSPLPARDRAAHRALPYYPYDPVWRILADVASVAPTLCKIAASDGVVYRFTHFATARFVLSGRPHGLPLYWLEGYGGGLFLPFRDATSGTETYAAGRYLVDTVKGADLGMEAGRLILDFNFAYNPSCAYDPAWSCPLAPRGSHLQVPVRAGERAPEPAIAGAIDHERD